MIKCRYILCSMYETGCNCVKLKISYNKMIYYLFKVFFYEIQFSFNDKEIVKSKSMLQYTEQ